MSSKVPNKTEKDTQKTHLQLVFSFHNTNETWNFESYSDSFLCTT